MKPATPECDCESKSKCACAGPSGCAVSISRMEPAVCKQPQLPVGQLCLRTLPRVMEQPSVSAPTMFIIPSPLSTLPRIISVSYLFPITQSPESITAIAHPREDHPHCSVSQDHLCVPHLVLWALSTSVLLATSKK